MIAIAKQNDRFFNYVIIALLVHIVSFVFIYFFSSFTFFKPTAPKVNIIKSSVRVDVVSMPKFTKKELKEMKLVPMSNKKQIQKSIAVKKEKILKEKVDKATKKVNLDSLFGNLSKKKIVKKAESKKDSKVTTKYQKELAKLVLEGNKISKGSAKTGSNDYSNSEAFVSYVQELPAYVRPHFRLPTYLIDKGLKCRIKVFISKTGDILNYRIFESSGDNEFDQRAINAMKMVSNFPVPSKDIALRVASGEVILGFPL